jgi:hypothetical protein
MKTTYDITALDIPLKIDAFLRLQFLCICQSTCPLQLLPSESTNFWWAWTWLVQMERNLSVLEKCLTLVCRCYVDIFFNVRRCHQGCSRLQTASLNTPLESAKKMELGPHRAPPPLKNNPSWPQVIGREK